MISWLTHQSKGNRKNKISLKSETLEHHQRTLSRNRESPTEWENIFLNCIYDKGEYVNINRTPITKK
jgi:hypothetical protein